MPGPSGRPELEPRRFDLATRTLSAGGLDLPGPRRFSFRVSVSRWENHRAPLIGGREQPMQPAELSRAVVVAADSAAAYLGTTKTLRRIDPSGHTRWSVSVPTEVTAVGLDEAGTRRLPALSGAGASVLPGPAAELPPALRDEARRGVALCTLAELEETFLVTYGDSYLPFDYLGPLRDLRAHPEAQGTMAVWKNEGRFDRSNTIVRGELVACYRKQPRDEAPDPAFDHIDYGATALLRTEIASVATDQVVGLDRIQHELAAAGALLGFCAQIAVMHPSQHRRAGRGGHRRPARPGPAFRGASR